MANTRRSGRPGAGADDPAIREIRRYHDIGRRALGRVPAGAEPVARTTGRLAAEAGVSPDLIRKARKFARLFDEGDLEGLCRLRTPAGASLTWTHVRFLLTVSDKPRRDELARRAAEGGWSSRDLKAEVEAGGGGPRSRGGRPGRRPRTPRAALRERIGLCEKLRRFWDEVEGQAIRSWVGGPLPAEAGGRGRDLAAEAVAKLREVEALARRAARRLRQAADAEVVRPDRASEPQADLPPPLPE